MTYINCWECSIGTDDNGKGNGIWLDGCLKFCSKIGPRFILWCQSMLTGKITVILKILNLYLNKNYKLNIIPGCGRIRGGIWDIGICCLIHLLLLLGIWGFWALGVVAGLKLWGVGGILCSECSIVYK